MGSRVLDRAFDLRQLSVRILLQTSRQGMIPQLIVDIQHIVSDEKCYETVRKFQMAPWDEMPTLPCDVHHQTSVAMRRNLLDKNIGARSVANGLMI